MDSDIHEEEEEERDASQDVIETDPHAVDVFNKLLLCVSEDEVIAKDAMAGKYHPCRHPDCTSHVYAADLCFDHHQNEKK